MSPHLPASAAAHPMDLEELERDPVPAAGVVVEEGRGGLAFALIHGESLVATAAWAAGEAGVELVDASLDWDVVVDRQEPMVLHDPLCPMTPPDFIARCVRSAEETGRVVIGVRPVTDTVKEISADGVVGATRDRDALVAVCSPVVLPSNVLARVVSAGGTGTVDFTELLARLRADDVEVALLEAPVSARRVGSVEDVAVLEAQTLPAR